MKLFIILSIFIGVGIIYAVCILIKEHKSKIFKERLSLRNLKENTETSAIEIKQKDKRLEQFEHSLSDEKKRNEDLSLQIKELMGKYTELDSRLERKNKELKQITTSFNRELKFQLEKTKIKEIMTREVISINMDSPFSQVPKKFREFSIRHLPVVDDNGKLVGLITQRAMYKIKPPRKLLDGEWYYDNEMFDNVILKHVMLKGPFTLTPEDSMGEAVKKMVNSKYGSIPIVEEGNKLCGIVTRGDILKIAAKAYSHKESI